MLFLLACAVMLLSSVQPSAAMERRGARLSRTSIYLGVMDMQCIVIDYENPNAVYTYTNSNPKVASVSEKGCVTGRKPGKTEILVEQSVGNQTTQVGTVTVTVKKAYVRGSLDYRPYKTLTSQPGYYRSRYEAGDPEHVMYDIRFDIAYYNRKAVYHFYSNDKKKLVLDTNGDVMDTGGAGAVRVTVKETYKDKTRKVGSFTLHIEHPSMDVPEPACELVKGQWRNVEAYLRNCQKYMIQVTDTPQPDKAAVAAAADGEYMPDQADDVLPIKGGPWPKMYAAEIGTRYLHVFMYDYIQHKYVAHLGSVKVNVRFCQMEFSMHPQGYPQERYNNKDGFLLRAYSSAKEPFTMNQEYAKLSLSVSDYEYLDEIGTKGLEVSSSDESVVKAVPDRLMDYISYTGNLFLTAYRPGTAVVTLKKNGAETSFKVTVKPVAVYTNSSCQARAYLTCDETVRKKDIVLASSDPSIAVMETLWINDPNFNGSEVKDAGFRIITKDAAGPVTLTASYEGRVIYAIVLDVQKNRNQ